jgi:hypothetical protein
MFQLFTRIPGIRLASKPALLAKNAALALCLMTSASGISAFADDFTVQDLQDKWDALRASSKAGSKTVQEEVDDMKFWHKKWEDGGKVKAGSPFIGSDFVALINPFSPDVLLTFSFISLPDGQFLNVPAIGSVLYEFNADPSFPNDFTIIGTSNDSASRFSLQWSVTGFEPIVRATPLDAIGTPIFLDEGDGLNSAQGLAIAVQTPEPATVFITASGLLGVLWLTARKRHRVE